MAILTKDVLPNILSLFFPSSWHLVEICFLIICNKRIYSLGNIFNTDDLADTIDTLQIIISSKQISVENILLHYIFLPVYNSQVSHIHQLHTAALLPSLQDSISCVCRLGNGHMIGYFIFLLFWFASIMNQQILGDCLMQQNKKTTGCLHYRDCYCNWKDKMPPWEVI